MSTSYNGFVAGLCLHHQKLGVSGKHICLPLHCILLYVHHINIVELLNKSHRDYYGIGIHHERTLAGAKADKTILLLKPAEQQTYQESENGTNTRNHAALEKENA